MTTYDIMTTNFVLTTYDVKTEYDVVTECEVLTTYLEMTKYDVMTTYGVMTTPLQIWCHDQIIRQYHIWRHNTYDLTSFNVIGVMATDAVNTTYNIMVKYDVITK